MGAVVQYSVATLLVLVGLAKASDIRRFVLVIRQIGPAAPSLAWPLAVLIVLTEIVTSVLLLTDSYARLALLASTLLFALFALTLAFVLIVGQRAGSCGCFGRWSPRLSWLSVLQNVFLAAAAGIAAWQR